MQSATTQASNNDIEAHVDVSLYYHGGDQSARRKERIELFVKLAKRNGIKLNDLSRLNLDDLRSELTKVRIAKSQHKCCFLFLYITKKIFKTLMMMVHLKICIVLFNVLNR